MSIEKQRLNQTVKLDDFCFMRQGKCLKPMSQEERILLAPVSKEKNTSGHALLLLHGFASSPAVYRAMLNQLSGYDALFCPVLPGHGQSLSSFSATKAHDWLRFVENTYDHIALKYDRIDVLGLSLGGLLACHLAKQKPVHHVYLLAPALALSHFPMISSWIVRLLEKMRVQSIPNRGGDLLDTTYGELTFQRLPPSAIREIFQLIHTFGFTPFSSPTTVFFGKHDKVIHNHRAHEILSSLPHLTTVWLERSAHLLPLDYDRQCIVDALNAQWL